MSHEHFRNEPEPLSMSADYVASWLEWAKRPESAAMVRHLNTRVRDANAREENLRQQITALAQRLSQYEQPASNAVRDPVWTGD